MTTFPTRYAYIVFITWDSGLATLEAYRRKRDAEARAEAIRREADELEEDTQATTFSLRLKDEP